MLRCLQRSNAVMFQITPYKVKKLKQTLHVVPEVWGMKVIYSAEKTGRLYLQEIFLALRAKFGRKGYVNEKFQRHNQSRTRELPACSVVPQPTATPRAPYHRIKGPGSLNLLYSVCPKAVRTKTAVEPCLIYVEGLLCVRQHPQQCTLYYFTHLRYIWE